MENQINEKKNKEIKNPNDPKNELRKNIQSPRKKRVSSNTDNHITSTSLSSSTSKSDSLHKLILRILVGAIMISSFSIIIYGGHIYVWMLVVCLQALIFRELVNVFYRAAAEKNIPWFRSIQWCWFITAMLYNYGSSLYLWFRSNPTKMINPMLLDYLPYHTWVSFMLYVLLFVTSVLSLKKGYYKYQMGQFTWTLVTLGLIVFQMKYILLNIFHGLYWMVFPSSLVIFNDCFAFFCGKLFGRRFIKAGFLKLSPKKTWEGFLGAFICTVIFSFYFSAYLAKYQKMICPVENLQLTPEDLTCTPGRVFQQVEYKIPKILKLYIHKDKIKLLPIQLHAFVFAVFTSLIAPFGGFYASAIKRTHHIKDFDTVIPGHGGVMDRMDCQFITALFTAVYYSTFIQATEWTVPFIINQISKMSKDDQHIIFEKLNNMLT